ncbi:MAG: hypothetical protein A2033_06815 [Bacteroidetes bacterium GWA2_31_9]|nr:MAG: hypothetical protein A2033_06815 [Bacteroidetes bacterium GWA2_31_9]
MIDTCITAYCVINDNKIVINGETYFKDNESQDFNEFIKAAYRFSNINYLKFFKMDRLCKLGFVVADLLIKQTAILEKYDSKNISIVFSNRASSLDTDREHQQSINDRNNYFPSPSVFVYTLPNIVTGEISIRHKIYGENIFFISNQFDEKLLYNYINTLFSSSSTDCCIAGWIDIDKNSYKAIIYIIEKSTNNSKDIIFDTENLKKLYIKN